ncbi:MAG: aminotransferase class V-fold PLP-dependent enzyme [Candidatus Nitrospinota bacterium M3_3B_026]
MSRFVYLDNAATSYPKPRSVVSAVARAVERGGGNPGRGGGRRAVAASRLVFDARMSIAEFFGFSHPERIIFTRNATEGLNMALKGLLRRGDAAAVSALEHNAVIRPLTALKKRGVKFFTAPLNAYGLPDPRRVPDVKMLVTTAASNVTGALADVEALGRACRGRGVLLVVDAAQTAGSVPFDASNIDVLVLTGHKGLLGPQGIGFVYFAPGVEPATWIEGGTGSDSESPHMPGYWPDRHEAGTVNTPGIAGLAAGIAFLKRKTVQAAREKETELARVIMERFLDDERIEVYPPFEPERRASLVSFNIRGIDPAEAADALDRRGISLRAGLHCSPAAHRFLGTFPAGALRVSPGAMTGKRDILAFLSALDRVLGRR